MKNKIASLLRDLADRLDGGEQVSDEAIRLAGHWTTRFCREVLKKDITVIPARDSQGRQTLAVMGDNDDDAELH